jgi:hypothetical protein
LPVSTGPLKPLCGLLEFLEPHGESVSIGTILTPSRHLEQ